MPTVNVKISSEIISWALGQVQEEKLGEKLMANITKWLDGTKTPTFHQIEDFSRKANIPLGYFFLQTPPVEKNDLLEYRTIDSVQLANPSRNLIDIIHEMEDIQDWMRAYRQDMGFDKTLVAGCLKDVQDVNIIANRIRADLNLGENWYETVNNSREAFGMIRKQLEMCGVLVMMSGIVGKNTHRALDVNEFRAFAIMNDWAPLIFINTSDSYSAKLFSLVHETVHIWLGKSDFFNDRQGNTSGVSKMEVICNAAAGELIVPGEIFLERWNQHKAEVFTRIAELARYFHCGEIVIARKARDCKKINQKTYDQVVQRTIENYKQAKENKEANGGNYYHTMGSRLDGCFVRALCESINMGRTTYAEAYRLTNTNRKTFSEVARRLGGVE